MLAVAVAVVGSAMFAAFGCATRTGWERTEARACERVDPPRVCFQAQPDQGVELHLGQAVLLPGECARGPKGGKSGSLRAVVLRNGTPVERGRIRVARGKTVQLVWQDDELEVVARQRCDRTTR